MNNLEEFGLALKNDIFDMYPAWIGILAGIIVAVTLYIIL